MYGRSTPPWHTTMLGFASTLALTLALTGAAGAATSLGPEERLTASDPDGSDRFGHSVAIYGDVAVVGAPGDDEKATNAGAASRAI